MPRLKCGAGRRPKPVTLDPKVVWGVGMTLSRLALPLYVFGCPHNLLHTKPQPWLCLGLCAYMGAQVRDQTLSDWVPFLVVPWDPVSCQALCIRHQGLHARLPWMISRSWRKILSVERMVHQGQACVPWVCLAWHRITAA